VDEHRFSGAETSEQILSAPVDRTDRLAGQAGDEISWERPAEIRTSELDASDAPATRRALQHPPDGFDLRKFGHLLILSRGG
jgi:hypothetical protein